MLKLNINSIIQRNIQKKLIQLHSMLILGPSLFIEFVFIQIHPIQIAKIKYRKNSPENNKITFIQIYSVRISKQSFSSSA